MNTLTVTGNLAADPELRFTPTGRAVARFAIIENRRRPTQDGEGWEDNEPNYFRAEAWGSLAEHVAESSRKGDRLTVSGTIITDRWADKDSGEVRTAQRVRADEVGFNLKYHTVEATKAAGNQADASPEPESGS